MRRHTMKQRTISVLTTVLTAAAVIAAPTASVTAAVPAAAAGYYEVTEIKYESARSFADGLAAVKLDGKWGFIDKTGKEVVPPKYDDLSLFSDGLARVKVGDQFGYIDAAGKEVLPPVYDAANLFSEGLAAVSSEELFGFGWQYIDKSGAVVFSIPYGNPGMFSGGLASASEWINEQHVYGFIDKTGKMITPAKYSYAEPFKEGVAWVSAGGKLGLVDSTGKELVEPKYDRKGGFSADNGGLSWVEENGRLSVINTSGKEVIAAGEFDSCGYFSHGLLNARRGAKIGFLDAAGKVIIPLQYDIAWPFSEGLAVVSVGAEANDTTQTISGGKWGYIDTTGKEVVPLIYDEAARGGFSNGMASVRLGEKWGMIDKEGKVIVPFEYEVTISISERYAMVNSDGRCGMIDTRTGEMVVPLQYTYIETLMDGFAAVLRDGKWGYIALGDAPVSNLDTASSWARESIISAISKGFVPVDIQANYADVITRQEFCRLAVKFVEYHTGKSIDSVLAEQGLSRNPDAFRDTNDPNILAAYALGITSGTSSGAFSPDGQFSREQAAAMITNVCRVIGMDTESPSPSQFADTDAVAPWAADGVSFCHSAGIMSGTGGNKFSPQGAYTRQESIAVFDRIQPL